MRERAIVALDLPERQAIETAGRLTGRARWLKVGMTTYYAAGPEPVAALRKMGFDVFVDLKLHDIPHQVAGAAEALGTLGAGMLTVHASGGAEMIRAAVGGAARGAERAGLPAPAVLAVTVLTSLDDAALSTLGVTGGAAAQVDRLTRLAAEAGADGVVCSPMEAAAARAILGPHALVVTPGVRPDWASSDDQARIATPARAFASGASHVVIGRPVTGAEDPAEAFERIVTETEGQTPRKGEHA